MEIGAKIKNARKLSGLTQEQAAEELGVSRQTISNWENEKSYPDIISVIKMSDLYSVSLDHLLKEEIPMNKPNLEYLEESTNTVKSNDRLAKIILIAVSLVIWTAAEIVFFFLAKGPELSLCNIVFRWILLPLTGAIVSFTAYRNNYWSKAKWFLIPIFALLFLLVPNSTFMEADGMATHTFIFPDYLYAPVGAAASLVGFVTGIMCGKYKK